jgi:hypothetical protein
MAYSVRKIGQPNTLDFRAYIEKDGVPISPFHDIPLYANEQKTILNMVVEIPRWTNAKQEVIPLTDSPENPCPAPVQSNPVQSNSTTKKRKEGELAANHVNCCLSRSARTNSSTLSNRMSRRASCGLCATASRTRAISGTMVLSLV